MRAADIEVGLTYVVRVPERPGDGEDQWLPVLWLLKGTQFPITVVALDSSGPTCEVEGLRVVDSGHVDVELTSEQVDRLGLPPGEYHIAGQLRTADGTPIALPDVNRVRVPARWLRPGDLHR
jgi:hypothetical protein